MKVLEELPYDVVVSIDSEDLNKYLISNIEFVQTALLPRSDSWMRNFPHYRSNWVKRREAMYKEFIRDSSYYDVTKLKDIVLMIGVFKQEVIYIAIDNEMETDPYRIIKGKLPDDKDAVLKVIDAFKAKLLLEREDQVFYFPTSYHAAKLVYGGVIKDVEPIVFTGWLREKEYAGEHDMLFIENDDPHVDDSPLTMQLADKISNRIVTVRYWVSDVAMSKEELMESYIRVAHGDVEVHGHLNYSEYTGCWGATEDLKVGGHDLLVELYFNIDKFIYLEVYDHLPAPRKETQCAKSYLLSLIRSS